jgi:hypothetical protein
MVGPLATALACSLTHFSKSCARLALTRRRGMLLRSHYHYDHGYLLGDIDEIDEDYTTTASSRCAHHARGTVLESSAVCSLHSDCSPHSQRVDNYRLMPRVNNRSESYSQLGEDGWYERCLEDRQRLPLDLKALPYSRGSHGAPLVRNKIVEALESVGKLNEGTCVVYNNGLYDGGLFNIKPSGYGKLNPTILFCMQACLGYGVTIQ